MMVRETEAAERNARTIGDRIARLYAADAGGPWLTLLFGNRATVSLTYRDFIDGAQGVAGLLSGLGVGRADRVVVILDHTEELYTAYAGALLIGAVPSFYAPPSPKFSTARFLETVGALIDIAAPRAIVTTPEIAELLKPLCREDVLIVSAPSLVDAGAVPFKGGPAGIDPDTASFLQFSSGTTGLRKGIAISHRQLLWQVDAYAAEIGLGPDDRIASWLPLYHDMGLLTAFFMPLLTGCPVVAMSPFEWVRHPFRLLQAIDACRCSLCWLPNFAYHVLARAAQDDLVSQLDLSCVRGLVNCSEPVTQSAHEALLERLRPAALDGGVFATSYAMAENTFAVTSGGFAGGLCIERVDRQVIATRGQALPVDETAPNARVIVGSGRSLANTEIRILDETGGTLPDRVVGEIALRSPCLFSGYLGKAEAPAARFVDGFYRTGDQGYMVDGQLFVIGRISDTIILRGKNLFPEDIEAAAGSVPEVIPGRCAAFGVFDEATGTDRLVVVVESNSPTPQPVMRKVHAVIGEVLDLTPDEVCVVPPGWLQKSTSGKLSRSANRRKYLSARTLDAPAPADDGKSPTSHPNDTSGDLLSVTRACVHKVVRQRSCFADAVIGDDEPLIASGLLDSFQLAMLVVELEKQFGIRIPTAALADLESFSTIRATADLCRFLPHAEANDKSDVRLTDIHSSIARNLVAKLNTRRYDLLPQMRDYDRVGIVNGPTGRRVQANLRMDCVSTDGSGFRTAFWGGARRGFQDFLGHNGARALIAGNSTPFGVGASSDEAAVHNVLNRAIPDEGPRWYNVSVRASLFPDEQVVVMEVAPRDLDIVVFVSGLNDASYLAADVIRETGRTGAFPYEEYAPRHQARVDGIRQQMLDLLAHFGDHRPRILYALQPNAFWIDKPYAPEEKEILSLYAADTDLLAKVLRSTFFRKVQNDHARALRDACLSIGVDFIDTNTEEEFASPDWLFADAAHLTDKGQQALARVILRWLNGAAANHSGVPQRRRVAVA
ncbi:non-ribosomal peptide synthetase [Azospirillum soli]|uniref:non-ribosomal peptide synthetase n=1 Tax=Azospirillum soli TaxID=1304799 RepID=UPI001AEAFEA3|nr:AMP-binding protein [Azospirillum soli]MBP2316252.1 acyl-CoA synthetase (AMP-forming)/AMP-acid ligase II/acyl carrier protein/lysophospholipase L1-like esterase [Azospirillum soli]